MDLFSEVIAQFPYPVALFDCNGVLIAANRIFMDKARIEREDVEKKRIHFISRITDENCAVLDAVEDAFSGETTVLENLKDPLSMFAGRDYTPDPAEPYRHAVFFPVPERGGIHYGAVMLMK